MDKNKLVTKGYIYKWEANDFGRILYDVGWGEKFGSEYRYNLTDEEFLGQLNGKRVKVTVEVIEDGS